MPAAKSQTAAIQPSDSLPSPSTLAATGGPLASEASRKTYRWSSKELDAVDRTRKIVDLSLVSLAVV